MRVTLPEEVRMRGDERQQAAMWEPQRPGTARAPGPPPAADPGHGRRRTAGVVAAVRGAVRQTGPPLDRPGETAASPRAPAPVLGAERTAVDGATGLQPAVPLVRGVEYGRSHLGCDGV